MTYYEILGLPRDASPDEIEQAYRTLARAVHPDLNAGDGARAEARMKELNEIRETLCDPLLRSAYDTRLRREEEDRAAAFRAAEAGPAGEYARVVDHRAPAGDGAFRAPPGEGRHGRRGVFSALMFAAVVAAVGVGGVVWGWSHRPPEPPPAPVVETASQSPAAKPHHVTRAVPAPASQDHPHGQRGVVKIGSTAGEVMRVLGPPDRTEPGSRPGNVVYVYGQLRLELHNGAVVSGGL